MEKNQDLNQIEQQIKTINNQIQELKTEKDKIISSIKNETIGGIKKWILRWIGGGILSLILMYWTICAGVTRSATNSIREKFAEPKITQTLNEVAQNEAKKIIEDSLNPAVLNATIQINKKIEFFEKDIQEFKNKYDLQLENLVKEVEYLKNRKEVLRLGDEAIATGKSAPFEELENIYYTSDDKDIKMVALSEIFRVKNQFATMTRIKGVDVTYTYPQTKKEFKENDIPTEALIQGLKEAPTWQSRAKIAEILRGRKEKRVPEALLDTIKSDDYLEVRKKAMDSFESITGFTSRDIFKYDPAKQWWETNKVNVEKNLKDLQTIKEAINKNSQN